MQPRRRYNNFPIIKQLFIPFLVFVGILFLILYLSGQWLPSYDLHITSLGVCTSHSRVDLEVSIPTDVVSLYICGKAEGTTFLNTDFLLFKENSLVYRERYRLEPGEFYFQVPVADLTPSPGHYRIDATHGRLTIAQAEFEVHEP